jgi:hypothetical protein
MARTILIIAGPSDYEQLVGYCRELGLHLLPACIGSPIPAPSVSQMCYLGSMKESELHPYGNPPIRVTDVRDPLLLFIRPYYDPPYLTDGSISLNEDNKAVSALIKPAFEKIRKWVKLNWSKTNQFASYIGPEAQSLLSENKAEWRSWLHNAEGHVVLIK